MISTSWPRPMAKSSSSKKPLEDEYLRSKRKQISIFMSPVNVHVNRMPVGGVVSFFKYHPGKYLVAWHPKSSTENERTTVVVKMNNGVEILFRQIAGALARRIKCYVKTGQPFPPGTGVRVHKIWLACRHISSAKCQSSCFHWRYHKRRPHHHCRAALKKFIRK